MVGITASWARRLSWHFPRGSCREAERCAHSACVWHRRAHLCKLRGIQQDVEKGGIELDTCNNVLLRGPVNILHDPVSALPFTQGVITAVTSDARKKVASWTMQARPLACFFFWLAKASEA